MTAYIYRENECINEYELPDIMSFNVLREKKITVEEAKKVEFENTANFGRWLLFNNYVRSGFKIEFK